MRRAAAWLGGILVAVGVLFNWRAAFNAGYGVLDRVVIGLKS